MTTSFWMSPSFSSIANALITFAILYAFIFIAGLKIISENKNSVMRYASLLIMSTLVAILFCAQFWYKKIYEDSLLSTSLLIILFFMTLLLAFFIGILHNKYVTFLSSETGKKNNKFLIGMLLIGALSSWLLAGTRDKLLIRDDLLKLYENQAALFLGGEGDVTVLKKHPELIDQMLEHSLQYKRTETGLSEADNAEQATYVTKLVHAKRQDYYMHASNDLIDKQFMALIHLYKVAIANNKKNCVALVLNNNVEKLVGRSTELNGALTAFDEQETQLIEQTDLSSPIQAFDDQKAFALMDKDVPPELREKLQSKPSTAEEECDIQFAHMEHMAQLPKEDRVLIARGIFSAKNQNDRQEAP